MMLRGLIEEIIRRRLWPVPLVALLVAGAAPLLFLKSAPDGAPSAAQIAQNAPAVPAAADLPASAQRLLTTTDRAPSASKRPKHGKDPFQTPAGVRSSTATTAATSSTAAAPSTTSSGGATSAGADGKQGTPTTGSPKQPAVKTVSVAAVDVRFSKHGTRHVNRSIPQLKAFSAAGRVIASFVRYSPKRKAAVFAVSPGTVVSGVKCRQPQGVCRYIDIKAGKHAQLKLFTSDGLVISRRIDVVHITVTSVSSTATLPPSPANGACLLKKLLELKLTDAPVLRDACA